MVDDPKELDKIVKNARRNKFKKELRNASEIKANKSSPELKKYMIRKLNEIEGSQGIHCILDKGTLYSKYLRDHKSKLYNYVAGSMASAIVLDSGIVEIRIDKSMGNQILQREFNIYFENKLRSGSNIGTVKIYHSRSENFSGIQLVDLLSSAVYQKYNNNDSTYLELIDLGKFPQTFIELWKSRK